MGDSFDAQSDPTDKGYEGEVDIIRAPAAKAVAAVDVSPVAEGNGLFELPQRCHGDVAVGPLNVRLVDDELRMVPMLSAESAK